MRETDASWLAALDHELAARGIGSVDRAEALVEAEGFLADAGGNAIEQFGTPADYAEQLASAVRNGQRANHPANGGRTVLEATGITKSYHGTKVMSGVSLSVTAGDVVALVGPNGAGKSTLLRVLAGLERPDAGHVERHGGIGVGYVPQDGGLDPYLRPSEHFVLFGTARGLTAAHARREGDRLARELGWDGAGSASIAAELSGGTRQKLSVIVAVIGGPPILLLDEPYQGMDAASTRRFWELLWAASDDGAAVVVSSHDDTLLNRARTIIEMEGEHDPV